MAEDYAKFRRGTSFSVRFPTLPSLTAQPRRVDLYEEQWAHDLLKMEFSAESPLWFASLKTGVPVQFNWTQDTLSRSFIGYVSNVSKVDAPQRQTSMVVTCIGGTYPLKERVTRVFKNSTIPQAVQQIVEGFGFNFVGIDHPQLFTQLVIAGQSYWEWINEQAKKIGYGVVVDGMAFIFKPLDNLINLGFTNAPVLAIGDKRVPYNVQFLDRTLDYFKVISGDHVQDNADSRAVKNVGGVDPLTAKPFLAEQNPGESGTNLRANVSDVLFSEYRTERVINDPSAAQTAAEDAAELARFSIPARVQCQGDPRIRPFGTVQVSGTGSLTDGYWVVREARHMFHKIGDYIMELTVATDGLGQTVQNGFRTRGTNPVGTVNLVEVLSNSTTPIVELGQNKAVLRTSSLIIKEHEQGFKRTPTLWKAV